MNVKVVCIFLFSVCLQLDSLPTSIQYGNVSQSRNGKGLIYLKQALTSIEQKLGNIGKEVSCSLCKMLTGVLHYFIDNTFTEKEIVKAVTKICIDLKIEDHRVCYGVVREFKEEVLTVFDKAVVTPDDICGTVLGPSCAKAGAAYGPWNVTFPNSTRERKRTVWNRLPSVHVPVCLSIYEL